MKQVLVLIIAGLLGITSLPARAQEKALSGEESNGRSRAIGIHTNVLYWGAMTPNIGVEIPLARRLSFDVTGMYAPWEFKDNKKYKMWAIQPEFKFWCCQTMTRHYIGLNVQYAQYNIGGEMYRREGFLCGAGISYGYVWVVNPRWNIDFSIGAGYAHIDYDKYAQKCNQKLDEKTHNYWGPTKAGITFVYKIPY